MAHCHSDQTNSRNLDKGGCVFLLDLFRKQANGRTPYEWFEQVILGILVFTIAIIYCIFVDPLNHYFGR